MFGRRFFEPQVGADSAIGAKSQCSGGAEVGANRYRYRYRYRGMAGAVT